MRGELAAELHERGRFDWASGVGARIAGRIVDGGERAAHLTRSALHRCLQRHGISRLPDIEGDKPKRQRFKRYPIGFFHIDIAEVQTAEGKLYLFVGIDRTSKFAVTQLVDKADRRTAWEFLEHLLKAVPYRIHTILTDNGIQFAE
ncbi:IS30 family transposase [Sphingomonas yabuuchiae]|uniref:IS30 family transposase n=1 Tax=Sphingomonas yabuuchiae TaxID=172044 RepID=A0ABR6KCJ6_9SPHN|nr:IS30 family transposase [Sphingomonas yabuuchiae]